MLHRVDPSCLHDSINMKLLIVLALVAMACARPEEFYNTRYDDFNVEELIANERLLKAYAHCFIGDGKCTPEGNDIKKWMPEATTSSCAKCTEKQKTLVAKTIIAIKTKLPTEYAALIKKNDPENKHADELQKFIDKYSA